MARAAAVPDDVLASAARIVGTRGAGALTMGALARATGFSRATLYRKAGGRSALLDALAATGADVGDRAGVRARILLAARDVFGRMGFDAASLDEIASVARVGVATVYRHFGDKDGLVAAFLDALAPRRAARQIRATDDVRYDLERLATQILSGVRDDAPLVRLFFLEALKGSPLLGRVRAKAPTRMLESVASLLEQHRAAGRLRDLDPRLLAQSFGGMLLAFGVIPLLVRGDPAGDPVLTARAVTDLFLAGALPRGRSRL
jgi:AcrR family transcriptional regulator